MKELRENRNLSLIPSASSSSSSLSLFIYWCMFVHVTKHGIEIHISMNDMNRNNFSHFTIRCHLNERSSTLLFVIEHLCLNGMRLIKRIFVNIKHHSDLNDKFLFLFSALTMKKASKSAHLQQYLISSSLFYAIRQFFLSFLFVWIKRKKIISHEWLVGFELFIKFFHLI